MKASGLTSRQSAFVAQILVDSNATKAAIAAGYSSRTASAIATENLRKPEIASAVAQARKERAQRVEVEADDVLRQVSRMAFVDVRRLVDKNSRPIPLHLLPDDVVAAIQAVEITETPEGRTFRYRLTDRTAAADKPMKHLGLYERDNRQGAEAIADLLSAIHSAGSRLRVRP